MTPETSTRARAGAVMGWVLAALVTTLGCGNSDDTSAGGGTSTNPTTTTGTGSCTVPASSCDLLTTSEAAAALDATSSTAAPGTSTSTSATSGAGLCTWNTTSSATEFQGQLGVEYACDGLDTPPSAEVTLINDLISSGKGVAVSGVGDVAAWEETTAIAATDASAIGGGTLTAAFTGGSITLVLTGDDTPANLQARATTAAKLVIPRL